MVYIQFPLSGSLLTTQNEGVRAALYQNLVPKLMMICIIRHHTRDLTEQHTRHDAHDVDRKWKKVWVNLRGINVCPGLSGSAEGYSKKQVYPTLATIWHSTFISSARDSVWSYISLIHFSLIVLLNRRDEFVTHWDKIKGYTNDWWFLVCGFERFSGAKHNGWFSKWYFVFRTASFVFCCWQEINIIFYLFNMLRIHLLKGVTVVFEP